MSENYTEMCQDIKGVLGKLYKEMPKTMESFGNLSQSGSKDGAISAKHKELMALAIGIAKRCDACIGLHVEKLIKLGVTREEILETLSVTIYMGGGPSLMYAVNAFKAYEELSSK